MPGPSAREMLSKLPLRMANGGPINLSEEAAYDQSAAYKRALESGGEEGVQTYYANLRELADKYMAGEGQFAGNQPIGVEAYNAMLESGISNTDLINAGVGQDVLDKIFTIEVEDPGTLVGSYTSPGMESAYVTNPVLAAEAARRTAEGDPGIESLRRQARNYLANIQQDGISPEEQRLLRELALEGGYTLDDITAAGIDPGILFNIPKPQVKVCPPGTLREGQTIPIGESCGIKPPVVDPFPQTQETYTPPTVYTSEGFGTDPAIFEPGEPALDVAFRESPPRTEVTEDIFGEQQLVGFDYLPAAKLLSATGSGFSFTPPSVTSRPRTLMSTDQLNRYTRGRAAQDLRQLTGGSEEDYMRYRPLLERTGSYGGGLSRSQLYALMRQEQAREARAMADAGAGAFTPGQTPRTGTIADYIALNPDVVEDFNTQINEGRMSSDMTLEQFATNHYNTFGLKEMASGMRTPFTLTGGYAGATGALQARDLRDPTMGTRFMAKGGEAKKSEGTAKAMLSQLANGGEVTNKYDQYFMDLTADAGKLRTEDEDAFYALTERELGSFKGKYGNELQGAYGNRRLLGTDPETGRNVYVAELVADDLRNWGMSRGQRPSLQRLEIQGPRGYFATSSLPTASDYAAQEKHGFLSAARGNDIIDTGRRVKEYLDEYSRGVQRDIGNVLQSARLNPELAQQVMGFVQSQRPQELVYMPQYQLPEDVQLAEGVNRDLYNKMLLANLSGQQQQKAATRELLAALPEADLADLVYQYGAAPGYLLTQGGRARQPEYTNIEQLQRAAFQRGRQAQTFNPFTGRMENVYQELPYGSFKAFQVDPRTVANPRVTARYQTSYTPVSDLVSQYDMTPEQAFSTGYQEFGQRGLYDLADQLGLDRSYARSFAEQQPEYIEVNPYEERRIGAYTGSVADFVPRNLGLGYAYAQSPIYSELLRRYFDPVKGTLSYYRQNDPRFGTQLFAEGGAVKKFEGVDFSKYKELKDLWYMHPANTAGGLYKGIPSSSEEQAETMRRYTELSDQLSKDLNARGATAGMYDEAMLALGGTDVPSMRKALEEDLVFQKMGGIENFLKRADQYASYGKDLSTSPYRQNLVFLGRLRPDLDYINRQLAEQFARQGSGTAGYSAQMFADGGPVSSDFGPDDLQRQLEELDRQAIERDVRSAAQAPSDTDQETRTESRGMLERLNQSFFENVTQPVIGSALDMTVGLGDLAQLGVKKGAEALGIETKPFVPVSQRLQESAGVAGYDPYAPAAVATQILPFARAKQAGTVAATELGRLFPSLGRETAAYGGSELAAAGAREFMPDSTAAELLASVAGGTLSDIGSTGMTRRMADDIEPPDTESSRMLDDIEQAANVVRPTITEEIGDRKRVGTTGKYVGAPEGVDTPQKLAALTRSMTNLTKEGEFGRFWYERSGRQILDLTGGNKEDAEKIVQAIAITSANTPVAANFDYALQAYYQWKNGQPIQTGMYTTAMSNKLQKMFDGEDWAGRKTNNFYNNLMREIDPSKAQGVTTDIWMMRAFGFGKDAPTDAQYSFVENETKRIAQNLGWEPQQVQAAIWVALKSRMENDGVKKAVEEKSIKNGWMHYEEKNGKKVRVIDDQAKHAANWLETAMKYSPTEADKTAAGFDYADAAERNLAQISWESIPSRTSGHMPEIFEAPPEVVQDYHTQMSKAFLDDDGNDIIAKHFNVLSPGDFEAPGYFEELVSPGTQTQITVPRQYGVTNRLSEIRKQAKEEGWSKDKLDAALREATYATEPAARDLMLAYAAARGILLKQDGVGLHRPAFISKISRPKANGVEIDIGRPFTRRETAEIARLVAEEAGHTEYNPIGSPNGVRFINFDYLEAPNLDFQNLIARALNKADFDNNEEYTARMFGADTDYLGNNWQENFNGEGYLDASNLSGRPDLQREIRDIVTQLTPRISAVEEEFANKYGWTRNTSLNNYGEQAEEIASLPVRDRGSQAATNKRGKVTFEAFGGSLGDARQKLGITPEKIKQFKDANKGIKQTRIPEVQDAAEKLKAGDITTQEYLQTVEKFQPIKPLGAVQKRPTNEEIAMSLTKNEDDAAGIVGVNLDVPDGTMISSRLDIPAYEANDTWVVTLHDGSIDQGLAVGYGPTAVLNDVKFVTTGKGGKAALNIATGKQKGTIARINGSWENRDPAAVEKLAREILDGTAPDADQWTEVGMNPFRHSYFYRKSDGMPVANAEQVIQVGPLVLAKKVETRPVESPEHEIQTPKGTRYFKGGGDVDRKDDNRTYI